MAAAKWDSENTIKFVQEYKSHECLWNIKSSTYKNRNMRDAAISKIIEVMQIPGFGAPEVKNKIKNLRSTFAQERRKIELSKKSGTGTDNIYIPNIKWYKELESIYNYSDEKRTTLDNIEDNSEEAIIINEDGPPAQQIKLADTHEAIAGQGRKRSMQRRKDIGRAITELKSLHDAINTDVEENAYDLFGKSIASQLKKLSPESALVAQSRIQNILTELGLEDIREKDGSINKSTFSLYNISSHSISSDDTSTPPCGIDKPNSDLENNYYGDDLLATAIATSLQST